MNLNVIFQTLYIENVVYKYLLHVLIHFQIKKLFRIGFVLFQHDFAFHCLQFFLLWILPVQTFQKKQVLTGNQLHQGHIPQLHTHGNRLQKLFSGGWKDF